MVKVKIQQLLELLQQEVVLAEDMTMVMELMEEAVEEQLQTIVI